MKTEELDYEPGVLRVVQSKAETKSFYNKISKVNDLLGKHSEQQLREAGLKLLAVAPAERVIEIAFATGHCPGAAWAARVPSPAGLWPGG